MFTPSYQIGDEQDGNCVCHNGRVVLCGREYDLHGCGDEEREDAQHGGTKHAVPGSRTVHQQGEAGPKIRRSSLHQQVERGGDRCQRVGDVVGSVARSQDDGDVGDCLELRIGVKASGGGSVGKNYRLSGLSSSIRGKPGQYVCVGFQLFQAQSGRYQCTG